MKKWLITGVLVLTLATTAMTPALALSYDIGAPEGGMFAGATSVEPVITVGSGPTASSNIDRSKNTALIPPSFGSPESYLTGSGTSLIPQSAYTASGGTAYGTGANAGTIPSSGTATASGSISGTVPGGGANSTYVPVSETDIPAAEVTVGTANQFTLPEELINSDGSLGRLVIPTLGLDVKVYEDESLENLAKGVGHFKSTSCWNGNIGLAGHNRGVTTYFGKIHTMQKGDKIIYTTKLGTRTYQVFYVGQIEETDFSRLERTSENLITLITCVANTPTMRWCVQAREVS